MKRVGPYEILGEVGRGGMGAVYRARAVDGRPVAIKVLLSPGRSHTSSALDRFERERRLLASLGEDHGFVALLDHGMAPTGPYLVMPFVPGGTLRARLNRGPLPIDEALDLGLRVADALGRAHEQGLVHRDLKPENILFDEARRPLVSDLGLAKHFRDDVDGASRSVSLSKTGEALGTAGYMPQEQLNDGKSAGPPADVFALGAILYECFTGEAAFPGESAQERIVKVIEARQRPIRSLRPEVPKGVARVVERAIATDPAARHPDGRAFAAALREVAKEAPAARRSGALLGAAAVLIAFGLAAGGTAYVLDRSREGRKTDPVETPGPPPIPPPRSGGELGRGPALPAKREIPAVCASFRAGERMKLAAVLGDYSFKHAAAVESVAFAPDGKRAATGGDDELIRIWDVATATEVRTLKHDQSVTALDFSADGTRLLSGSSDRTLRLWDVATGAELFARRLPQALWGAVLSPDGKTALTACRDGDFRLHDLANRGEVIRTFASSRGTLVPSCAFSPDGELAALGTPDGVRIHDVATGALVRHEKETRREKGCTWAVFAPDGRSVISGGSELRMRRWDPRTGESRGTFEGHADDIRCGRPTRDGKRLFTCSKEETVRLWNLETGTELWSLPGHKHLLLAGAVSADGTRALSGGQDATARLWDIATPGGRDLTPEGGHRGPVSAVAFTPDGKEAVSGGREGAIRVWQLAGDGATSKLLGGHVSAICGLSVLTDGVRVVSVSEKGGLKLWDRAKGTALWFDDSKAVKITCAALAPDEKRALAGGPHGEIVEWDLEKRTRKPYNVVPFAIAAIAFGRDGNAMTMCGDNNLRLWEESGRGVNDIVALGEKDQVHAAAFTKDQKRVVVGGDRTLRLREISHDRSTRDVPSPRSVHLVAVSPDARRALTTGGWGHPIDLWDLDSAKIVETLDLASSGDVANAAAFSPDTRSLLVGTKRGVILRFELK